MKKLLLCCAISVILFATSCQKDEIEVQPSSEEVATTEPLSKEELDQFIVDAVNKTKTSFDWSTAPDHILWSAVKHSDGILIVGYKQSDWNDAQARSYMQENDIESRGLSKGLSEIKEEIINLISKGKPSSKKDFIVYENDKFLSLHLKLNSLEDIAALRADSNVRYVEPTYHPFAEELEQGSSTVQEGRSDLTTVGCGAYGPNYSLRNNYDYATLAPDAKISWNYRYHKIKEAWETGGISGRGTGQGIGVAVLDTGVGQYQQSLSQTQGFTSGYVTQRSTWHYNFLNTFEWAQDECGHGTALAGVVAAPRRGIGTMIGVAYGSNLYSCKVANGVLIRGEDVIRAVSNAYYYAANTANIRVTSISMGNVVRITEVADAIIFAYTRGKLNFAAAGTAAYVSWFSVPFSNLANIVFPANMSEYGGDVVMGVTGITTNYQRCSDCVQGPIVDFAVVMQQSNGTTPLGMARESNWPTTIGGSSVATATMAGIAAVVWGKTPTRPRADVVNALRATSDFPSGSNPIFGHGKANTQAAWNYMPN